MQIHVIDADDPLFYTRNMNGMRARGITPIVLYGMSNGVTVMVNQIIERAQQPNSIDLFQLHGHGGGGIQNISGGHADGTPHLAAISNGNFGQIRPILDRLTSYFTQDARIELMGCSVASNANGEQLLQKLARLWNHPIRAGVQVQYSNQPDEVFVFEGPITVAYPDGGLACASA
jgi:DNA polymerase III, alpha subunit